MTALVRSLEAAWQFREKAGALADRDALRIYHGHTEGASSVPRIAVEKFGSDAWVFEWENQGGVALEGAGIEQVSRWLQEKGMSSAVLLRRPKAGIPSESAEVLFGTPPEETFVQESHRIPAAYEIHFLKTRHPGLFLDHFPLRRWLFEHCRGKSILNTFAYTGSLSMVAGKAGAREVVTLDLSRSTTDWGRRNWERNGLGSEGDFIFGDVFEWLPRFAKKGRRFDQIILDPPSFSRTKKGTFSTSRDLPRLHALALAILEPGGHLITSINSENVSAEDFHQWVLEGAHAERRQLRKVQSLQACPDTFPRATHLKGAIYLAT